MLRLFFAVLCGREFALVVAVESPLSRTFSFGGCDGCGAKSAQADYEIFENK
jgi:hypothetical protein